MKHIMSLLLALALTFTLSAAALAEPLSLDGKVTAAYTSEVYATSTAIAGTVHVVLGQRVNAGDAVVTLRTTPVYAEEDGVITAVFAEPGDLADTLTTRYGAAVVMENDVVYTVAATTERAYDSVATKLVRVGENVSLRSRTNESRTGKAIITAVDGINYTLHVTDGSFIVGETVEVFRGEGFAESTCLGRGDVARNAPTLVTATGRIVKVHVQPGDEVIKGDLLLETLAGSGTSAVLTSNVDGVVAQINAVQGASLAENDVAAIIWPDDAMQIEASIHELDLKDVTIGQQVQLSFDWNEDSGKTMVGTVQSISAVSDAESTSTTYKLVVDFTPDAYVRYGMNVTITTIE